MYNPSKSLKASAALFAATTFAATPLIAGGASVPNTSTATTSLTAVSTVPSGGGGTDSGAPKTVGGGGGTPSAGFTGMAAYHFKDSVAASYFNAGFGTPTTLNGVSARTWVVEYSKTDGPYHVVVTEAGDMAFYPAE